MKTAVAFLLSFWAISTVWLLIGYVIDCWQDRHDERKEVAGMVAEVELYLASR